MQNVFFTSLGQEHSESGITDVNKVWKKTQHRD